MAPPSVRWAAVCAEKCHDNPDNPQPGRFHFKWKAIIYRPGSQEAVMAIASGCHTYESSANAQRGGEELVKSWGLKLKKYTKGNYA